MSWLQISNKIEMAYILRIDTPESKDYANRCAQSCIEHNIPFIFHEGYMKPTQAFIKEELDFDIPLMPGELGCTASHLKIWKDIINKGKTAAIFEHDVVVKRNFIGVEVPEESFLMLGYRVDNENDYQCPDTEYSMGEIFKFEGTHSYAITPQTAQTCMNIIWQQWHRRISQSIDGLIGINKLLGRRLIILDPTPTVCVVGNRISTAQDNVNPARYNESIVPSFYDNLNSSVKHKYKLIQNSTRMDF